MTESIEPNTGRTRRPPLAEIDSWELWQAWKRGERRLVLPWIGLLVSFCVVLAAAYSFFFFSSSASGDTTGQVVITIGFFALFVVLWRRISPRRRFALAVVGLIVVVAGVAFLLWLAAYRLSDWSPWVAIGGTLLLGLMGILIGLPSLDAIARRQEETLER
jgi:drug/metabolite transporter (DMT)-like permease